MKDAELKDIEKGVKQLLNLLKSPYLKIDLDKIDFEKILSDMSKLIVEIKKLKRGKKKC